MNDIRPIAGSSTALPALADPFGRQISYLRVTVTDRCDFRCVYCMSEHMTFLPKPDLLTLEELDRICTAFVSRGVEKLRITGGEPLVRRDIMTLFRSLSRHLDTGALKELSEKLGIGLIYKSSFDKANRTSGSAARGMGLEAALPIFRLRMVTIESGCMGAPFRP